MNRNPVTRKAIDIRLQGHGHDRSTLRPVGRILRKRAKGTCDMQPLSGSRQTNHPPDIQDLDHAINGDIILTRDHPIQRVLPDVHRRRAILQRDRRNQPGLHGFEQA